jgi:hypothetical protein
LEKTTGYQVVVIECFFFLCCHPSQIQTKPNLTRQPIVIGFQIAALEKKASRLVNAKAKSSATPPHAHAKPFLTAGCMQLQKSHKIIPANFVTEKVEFLSLL